MTFRWQRIQEYVKLRVYKFKQVEKFKYLQIREKLHLATLQP